MPLSVETRCPLKRTEERTALVCRKECPPQAERVLGKSRLLVLRPAPPTEGTKQKRGATYLPLESELKRKCKNSCPFQSIKVTMSHLFASYKFPSFLFSPKVGTVHPCGAWCLTPSGASPCQFSRPRSPTMCPSLGFRSYPVWSGCEIHR